MTQRFLRAAMLLLVTMLTVVTAWADNVTYIDANGTEQTVDATSITSTTTAMGTSGSTTWYYVSGTVENDNRIELSGTVNLILANGCDFKANHGLHLASGNTLNVYVQSALNGKLYAVNDNHHAAIGGNGGEDGENGTNGQDGGNVNIYGGVIEINGTLGGGNGGYGQGVYVRTDQVSQWVDDDWDEYGNPISQHEVFTDTDIYEGGIGGRGGNSGTICIYGGQVYIYGGDAAIGGGYGGWGNETTGSNGSGNVDLSWKNATDYVYIPYYNGTVTLQKPFTDEEHHVYAVGVHDDIDNVKLLPTTAAVEYHAEAAPTCTEVGYKQDCWYNYLTEKYYTDEACTQAHEIAASAVVIPALGHNIEHHAAQSATFTTAGNLEYWQCDRCDKYFGDANGENEFGANYASALFYSVEGNATDGYSIRIPKTGTHTLTLDNSVTSFKIYDEGGEGGSTTDDDQPGNYSNGCDGRLVLIAPENHSIPLTGDVMTESGNYDYLTVYRGTTADDNNILLNRKYSDTPDDASSIGSAVATSMLLYFHSDGGVNRAGLDLTVTLIYNLNEMAGITDAINEALKGKTVNIAFSRTFEKLSDGEGKASTLCLPFNLDKPSTTDVGTFYTFGGVSSDATGEYVVTMIEETADNLSAGTPYMFRPATTATGAISFQNTAYTVPDDGFTPAGTATDANGWKFKGTYQEKTWTEGQTHLYGFATSDYKKSDNSLLNEVGAFRRFSYGHINPFRCYLLAPGATEARGVSKAGNQLPESLKVILISASGEATAIGTLDTRTGEVTFDGEWYDLNGRRLNGKPTTKGLYINNGKTIVIK